MMRRDFLKTGVGGMGLALAGGVARGRNPGCGQECPALRRRMPISSLSRGRIRPQ